MEICHCSENVCQLRLDFDQFTITGPSTSTVSIGTTLFGQITNAAAGKKVTTSSQCLTDTFSVSSPSGGAPPTICGINTGQHMYVDSHPEDCNDLTLQLGQNGVGTGVAMRQWSIKITQYTCDFNNLAPDGCTQYYFGSSSQTVQTYNFDGGQHLARQDQNICVRRERGQCRICWTTAVPTDFQVSGKTASPGAFVNGLNGKECCNYGTAGIKTTYDCVTIPGAITALMMTKQGQERFCGRSAGIGGTTTTTGTMAPKTICSDRTPFNIRFLSDEYEFDAVTQMEAAKTNAGFRLTYIQNSMCT